LTIYVIKTTIEAVRNAEIESCKSLIFKSSTEIECLFLKNNLKNNEKFFEESMNKKHPALNPWLISQIEAEGKEVKKVVKNSHLLVATLINPIERLHKKGILTRQEMHAGIRHGHDYELAHLSHHSRPMYDGSAPAKGGKPIQKNIPQAQLNAAKRYEEARKAIVDLNEKERKKLPEILTLVFEQQKSFHSVEVILGTNHKLLEERVKLICETLLEL